ncbi:hypothetical protein HF925_08640 [Acidithiobacillus ferriphilus]|uniref:hypothetical protein n=1 Tax=Acidithiobacillus ferriphilus TaxID=1689834 RepID=UPI001C06FEFE|nr:hypothetical protein [Acidithiobacillus ferriphilus]MBU2848644.1 hypothetical protein [Acidithiobacillus ferriphilus]
MSYFVTVTFDINYAQMSPHGNNVYSKITDALDKIYYYKIVSGKNKRTLRLPSNTYVAEFDDASEHQTEVVESVKLELKRIFDRFSVSGKYFISTGRSWAWKVGSF